jgi:hypothetical protein
MMILYSPLEISWTDAVDGELQTLKFEIQWEDELEQLFCTMTMLIIIKPVQTQLVPHVKPYSLNQKYRLMKILPPSIFVNRCNR